MKKVGLIVEQIGEVVEQVGKLREHVGEVVNEQLRDQMLKILKFM